MEAHEMAKKKATKRKAVKKAAPKISDYAIQAYGEPENMCTSGRKCYDWLLALEKKGKTSRAIIALAKSKHPAWYNEFVEENLEGNNGYFEDDRDEVVQTLQDTENSENGSVKFSGAFTKALATEIKRLNALTDDRVVDLINSGSSYRPLEFSYVDA
jgi:hypothetical protein